MRGLHFVTHIALPSCRRLAGAVVSVPPKYPCGRSHWVRDTPTGAMTTAPPTSAMDFCPLHSITLSAVAARDCGTVRPSALAAARREPQLFQPKNHRPGHCVSDAKSASQVLQRVAE